MAKGKIIYGRAMIVAKADMPFITGRRYSFGATDITADIADVTPVKPRTGKTGSATIVADTRDDYYALCRVYDPGSHVYMDIAPLDPGAALCFNLPLNQSLTIAGIQQQLADIQVGTITYESLPDPGSFIPLMTDHLL